MAWLVKLRRFIDGLNERIGRAVSWLTLAIVCITAWDVTLRYLFRKGSVALQELEWHLFGPVFLLAAGYTLLHDEHVRVDIFYSRLSPKMKALIDLVGSLLFVIPLCVLLIWTSWGFVAASWRAGEESPDPGGLPARYLLKAVIPLGFLFIGLQALAMAIKSLYILLDLEGADPPEGEAP
ncbi:MAG: TRAP transporter small permease subunit [Nitrospinota bacterium]